MATIGDIYPDGFETQQSGIGLHLYSGGLEKWGVPLFIELQRAPEVSGSPGTYITIAHVPATPQALMDIDRAIKRISTGDTGYYYRARMTSPGLTPSAWSDVDFGEPKEFDHSYTLPPVPSYPKIGIDQRELPNDPTKASVTLRATPDHVDNVIKYQVLADTAAIPARSDASWLTYSGAFEVTRDDTNVQKIVAWGKLNGIIGNFYVQEVATDRVPVVLNITLVVSDSGSVDMEVTTDADAGSIRYAYSTSAYPNKTTTQSGTVANGRNITVTGMTTLTAGQTLYVSVLPYSQTGGAGIEGELARANVTYHTATSDNAVLDAMVMSRGDINRLYVELKAGANSFKWAAQTGSYPAAGTGTCVNLTTAQVDITASTPNYDTVYYITVTPYSGASCTGTQGVPFQITWERQWESGLIDDDTGWLGDPSILTQKKFENDSSELLRLSVAGTGVLQQPAAYSPADDNERTFFDQEQKHVPNQTVWGAGSVYGAQVRLQFSLHAETAGDTADHKVFCIADVADGTFWDASTGNGIYITWGGVNGDQAYIYKRVAGTNTQIGGYMQVNEDWRTDYIEFDIIVYEFNPVKFIVGLNGKFQVFDQAANPNLSAGFYFGLIADEVMDNVFKNVSGRTEVGTFYAKKFVVGDLGTAGDLDQTRQDVVVAGASPFFRLYETDAATNEKIWNVFMDGGDLFIGEEYDDESSNLKVVGFANFTGVIQEMQFAVATTGTMAAVFRQLPTGVSFLAITGYPNTPVIVESNVSSYQTGAPSNEKRWVWGADSNQDWRIGTLSDAGVYGETGLIIYRGTGNTVGAADFPNSSLAWGGGAAIASSNDVGTGDVNVSGTPVNNQVAVWTNADTIEGDPNLTWDGTKLLLLNATDIELSNTAILFIRNAAATATAAMQVDAGDDLHIGSSGSTGFDDVYIEVASAHTFYIRFGGAADFSMSTTAANFSGTSLAWGGGAAIASSDNVVNEGKDPVTWTGEHRFRGATDDVVDSATQVRIGVSSSTPRIQWEVNGQNLWQMDQDTSGNLRIFQSGDVWMSFTDGTPNIIYFTYELRKNNTPTSGQAMLTLLDTGGHLHSFEADDEDGIRFVSKTNPAAADPIFKVEDSGGVERLRVEYSGGVYTENLIFGVGGQTAATSEFSVSCSASTYSRIGYLGSARLEFNTNGIALYSEIAWGDDTTDTGQHAFVTRNQYAYEALTAYEVVYLRYDATSTRPEWAKADSDLADFVAKPVPWIGIVLNSPAANAVAEVVTHGYVYNASWTWGTTNAGKPLYVSAATAGAITATPPSGVGDIVYQIGWIVTDDLIFVDPQYLYEV